ncbi:MAG: ATP-binding protein, partial [Candidatus Micrarchaeia archaeon]
MAFYDFKEVLEKWNPWWALNEVPENKIGVPRAGVLEGLLEFVAAKEMVVVSGVRRSGKSTLLFQVINALLKKGISPKNVLYFNFDEPLPEKGTELLQKVYDSFLELNNPTGRQFLFFDEIQNISNWEKWLKTAYDLKAPQTKFFITGSNASMLSSKLAKLLTGRILSKQVFPLSFEEFLTFNNVRPEKFSLQKTELKHFLEKYLFQGGFPEAVLEKNQDVNHQRLKEYFDNILVRDVLTMQEVRNPAKLSELAQYAFANISSPLSYNKMSRATGLNINTLKEYLSFLEQAYLLFQVNFFSFSIKESLLIQKNRKIYCVDNALRNAVSVPFSKNAGKLAENVVFLELKRRGEQVFYWKDSNEVDFVVRKGSKLTAINVTYDDKPKKRERLTEKRFDHEY